VETLASFFFPRICWPSGNENVSPKLVMRRIHDMHWGALDTRREGMVNAGMESRWLLFVMERGGTWRREEICIRAP
jgi:hypothetical protein